MVNSAWAMINLADRCPTGVGSPKDVFFGGQQQLSGDMSYLHEEMPHLYR